MEGRLPFETIDLLIVDEMGKNINGAGMDPLVIGRPTIQKNRRNDLISATSSSRSHSGERWKRDWNRFADMTTWRLVRKIDYAAMYMNGITSSDTHDSKVPMAFDTDRDAIRTALNMNGLTPQSKPECAD